MKEVVGKAIRLENLCWANGYKNAGAHRAPENYKVVGRLQAYGVYVYQFTSDA
jgi:hypothetical protein